MTDIATGIDLKKLLEDIPRGAWVALSQDRDRVIGYGFDMGKVIEDAEREGESDPIILRVPESPGALIL